MDRWRGAAKFTRLQKLLFLIVPLCAISLIAIATKVVQTTTIPESHSRVESKIHARDKTALIVSSQHYKEPDYKEVYKHTESIQALNAYLRTLDPYSKYLASDEMVFLEKRNREYRTGIGLDFLLQGEQVLGVPVAQGPAYKAGMILPAYVRSINDRKIKYDDFSSYSFLTELPAGKLVRLSLVANKNLDRTDFAIESARHKHDPVSYYTYREILFVRIKRFTGGENRRFRKILDTSNQYEKLVFDLRYCPGGDVYAMVDMLSFILPEDLNVVSLEKADGQRGLALKTLSDRVVTGIPLYVLVSKFTASTAELFTWAIKKNYPNARVLGEATKGKCLAQDTFGFDDGSALRLTTYEVKNSFNQSCQGSPLVPDELIRGIALSSAQDIFEVLTPNSYRRKE